MPRKPRPGTTPIFAQVRDDVHAKADARRRRERVTWSTVITTLLLRWANGDDAALVKPVRAGRPATPDAAEAERLHEHLMATSEAYRRACTERVDPATLTWHRSLGALFATTARREGREPPSDLIAAVDAEQGDESGQ